MDRWKTESVETAFSHPLFDVERRRVVSDGNGPGAGEPHEVLAIASDDWVHVVPVLPDGRVVLVRQWRYATGGFHLELPGGVADEEDPRRAAERELAEETGFRAAELTRLGTVEPNPAILDNRLTVFLAEGLEPIPEEERPPPDEHEEIEVVLLDPEELRRRIAAGEVRHALMLSSYLLWQLHRAARASGERGG